MIVWSGRGILSVLVLTVTFIVCIYALPDGYARYGLVIPLFITGIFSWIYGIKWNNNSGTSIYEETGKRVTSGNKHSLFWIKMEYWGIIFVALGIIFIDKNSILDWALAGVVLLIFIFYKLRAASN